MGWKDWALGGLSTIGGITGVSMFGDYLGNKERKNAEKENRKMFTGMYEQGRADLAPYAGFGGRQLGQFENWLNTTNAPTYGGDPTMQDVMASPGYDMRLGAVENSAAARGGLFSGNALMDISEFGAREYDRARDRGIEDYNRESQAYNDEYNRRYGTSGMGFGAASNMASMGPGYANAMAGSRRNEAESQAGMYDAWGNRIMSGIGTIAGMG
jgi:hypothetical protein